MATLLDIVKKGSTDRSVTIRIIDDADGTPETGVAYNTSGIDLWYRRQGAAKTSITEASLSALTDAHSDGGFLAIGDGEYRLDLPDAAFATGANHVDIGGTVTGMIVIGGRVRLVDFDPEVANLAANVTQWSSTNVATPDSAGYPKVTIKSGTGTGEISLSSGRATADATYIGGFAASAFGMAVNGGYKQLILSGTPTTTTFQSTTVAFPSGTPLIGQVILWVNVISGNLVTGQTSIITGFTNSGTPTYTHTGVQTAPATGATGDVALLLPVTAGRDLRTILGTPITDLSEDLIALAQLMLRDDSGIATDRSSYLSAINADEGSGGGDVDNTVDSQQAIAAAVGAIDISGIETILGTPADTSIATDIANLQLDIDDVLTKIGTPSTSLAADIAAVQSSVDAIDVSSLSTIASNVSDVLTNIGSPAAGSLAADIAVVDGNVDLLVTRVGLPANTDLASDIAAVVTLIGTPTDTSLATDIANLQTDVDGITTTLSSPIDANLAEILGTAITEVTGGRIAGNFSTFWDNANADTTKVVDDVGGGGGGGSEGDLLVDTTIATLASQTSFTLTAGSGDDDAYNGGLIVVTDASTSTQKAVGLVSDYVGASKTISLAEDPGIFTMAVGDGVKIYAVPKQLPDAPHAANGGLPTVDASNRIAGIAGTINTLDGLDTAQDLQHAATQALIGTPVDTDLATDIANLQADVDAITTTLSSPIDANLAEILGTAITETTGGRIAGNFSTFWDNSDADTTKVVDNVGSGGGGGSEGDLLVDTTIATLASQTSFTLTAGSGDDDAYNGAMAVVTDSSTSTQKAVGLVSDYVGASKTISLAEDPGIFTMAVGDAIKLYAVPKQLPDAPHAANGGLPTVDASNRIAGIAGTINTLDGLDTAQDLQHATTQGLITTVDSVVDAIKAVTDALPDSGALTSLATAAALATVDANVDSILVDTGTTLDGKIDAIKAVTDALPDSGALTTLVNNVAAILVDTGTTLDGKIDAIKAVTDALPDSGALTSLAQASALSTVASNVAAILVDTGTTLDGKIDAIKAVTDALPDSGALTSIATAAALAVVDSNVDAIKAVTDALPDSGALTSLAQAADLLAYVQVITRNDAAIATDLSATLDAINADTGSGTGSFTPASESISAIAGNQPTNFSALLINSSGHISRVTTVDTVTSSDAPSAAAIADAVHDEQLADHEDAGSAGERLGRIPNAAAGGDGGLPTVDASNRIAGIAGTINTLDGLDTAQDLQHAATQAAIATVDGVVDTIQAVTDALPDNGALTSLAQASALSTVASNVAAILVDTGTTLDGKIDAIKAVTDALPDSGALTSLATAAALATVDANVDAILVDTATTIPGLIGTPTTDLATDLRAYVQLLARSDAAIETDRGDYLTLINANLGSGAGDFTSQTDSGEGVADTLSTAASNVAAIKTVTDALPDSGALTSLATAAALSTVASNVSAILVDTGTTLDGKIDAIKAVTDALPDSGALTSLATAAALATVDSNVDAIKAVTDVIPDSGALTTLVNNVAAILVDTGTTLDGKIDAIKAVTDVIPDSGALTSLATAAALATVDTVADSILATVQADIVIDTSQTPWQAVWLVKGSGGLGVGTEIMRKEIKDYQGNNITAATTVIAQATDV